MPVSPSVMVVATGRKRLSESCWKGYRKSGTHLNAKGVRDNVFAQRALGVPSFFKRSGEKPVFDALSVEAV